MHAAERRRPISEQVAATRVTQQIAPRFNQEVDRQLGSLNEALANRIRPALDSWGGFPGPVQAMTTSNALFVAVQTNATSRSHPAPPVLSAPGQGASVYVHESALNEMIASTPLAGLELPDTALQRLTRPDSVLPSDPATPQLATIVFDRTSPVRIESKNGLIEVIVRARFRPVLGPEVPAQIITLTVEPVLGPEQVTVRMQLQDVQPADPADADAVSTIAQNIIRQQLEQQLEEFEFPRSFDIPAARPVTIRLTTVKLEQGWLAATFHAGESTN